MVLVPGTKEFKKENEGTPDQYTFMYCAHCQTVIRHVPVPRLFGSQITVECYACKTEYKVSRALNKKTNKTMVTIMATLDIVDD